MRTNFDNMTAIGFHRLTGLSRPCLLAGRIIGVALALLGSAAISTAAAQQARPPAGAPVKLDPTTMIGNAVLLEIQAKAGEANFVDTLKNLEPTIRAGAGAKASSPIWVVAKTDLASLDASRFATASALEELARLHGDAQKADRAAAEKINAIRTNVAKIVTSQNDRVKALASRLAPG